MEEYIGKTMICLSIIVITVGGVFLCASRDGEAQRQWKSVRSKLIILGLCIGNTIFILLTGEKSFLSLGVFSILGGCLLAAAIMDWQEQMVYRFVWWIGGVVGVLWLLALKASAELWCQIGLFWILQEFWFARFYGRADSHAFCVCAIGMAAKGWGFSDYVMHMFWVYAGLALVQLIRRNIGRDGNLKQAVPLLPYITVAFWLWLDFSRGKWYI